MAIMAITLMAMASTILTSAIRTGKTSAMSSTSTHDQDGRMMARVPVRGPGCLVLASLLDGPLSGYAIIERISELSGGGLRMATGTMYAALDRLTAKGHVELVRTEIVNGRVRRSYGLTPARVAALRAGAERRAPATRPLAGRDRRAADGHPGPEGEPRGVTALERRCRLLLRAYPAWYRRGAGGGEGRHPAAGRPP